MNMNHIETPIVASKVEDEKRMNVLPQLFGKYLIKGEAMVFGWMDTLSPNYSGGYWDFYSLSNGGHFLAPQIAGGERTVQIESPNGFQGLVSDEAAGLIACLFALSNLMFYASARAGDADDLVEQYSLVRDYALEHAEAASILAAID